MGVINDPAFVEIARKIVREPGFSLAGPDAARRALGRLSELAEPRQRAGLADLLIIRWLRDEHAYFVQQQTRYADAPAAVTESGAPKVIPGDVEAGAAPELKFRSESPGWQPPSLPATPETSRSQAVDDNHNRYAAADNFPGGQDPGDAQTTDAAGELPLSLPSPRPVRSAAVQQPSAKVEAFRRMPGGALFPDLQMAREIAPGVTKVRARFGEQDERALAVNLGRQIDALLVQNAGDDERAESYERRARGHRVQIAARNQKITAMRTDREQAQRTADALAELGGVTGELPAHVLSACGFSRRVA